MEVGGIAVSHTTMKELNLCDGIYIAMKRLNLSEKNRVEFVCEEQIFFKSIDVICLSLVDAMIWLSGELMLE